MKGNTDRINQKHNSVNTMTTAVLNKIISRVMLEMWIPAGKVHYS